MAAGVPERAGMCYLVCSNVCNGEREWCVVVAGILGAQAKPVRCYNRCGAGARGSIRDKARSGKNAVRRPRAREPADKGAARTQTQGTSSSREAQEELKGSHPSATEFCMTALRVSG